MKLEGIKVGKNYSNGTTRNLHWLVLYKDNKGCLIEYTSGRRYVMPDTYDYSSWTECKPKIKKWIFCVLTRDSEYATLSYDNYVDAFDSQYSKWAKSLTTEIRKVEFDVP